MPRGIGDEGGRRDSAKHVVAERSGADSPHRLGDDGEHRRLEAEEQCRHPADIARRRIDPGQDHDRGEARQDEQYARDQAAFGAVHQPADIGGELLRLRARQKHAVIERVEEPGLAQPPSFLDEDPVHKRDLASRPAKAEQCDLRPYPGRLGERDFALRRRHAPPPKAKERKPPCPQTRSYIAAAAATSCRAVPVESKTKT